MSQTKPIVTNKQKQVLNRAKTNVNLVRTAKNQQGTKEVKNLQVQVKTLENQISKLKVESSASIQEKEAAKHAVRIIDPLDYSPRVLPDLYSTEAVCPVVPFTIREVDWNSSTDEEQDSDMQYIIATRDPFASTIISTNNEAYGVSSQQYKSRQIIVGSFVDDFNNGNFGPLTYDTTTGIEADPLHGSVLYPMVAASHGGKVFYLLNPGDTMNLDINLRPLTGIATTCTLRISQFGSPRTILENEQVVDAGGSTVDFTFTAQVLGYYCFSLQSIAPLTSGTSTARFQIDIGGDDSRTSNIWFGQHPIPHLEEKLASVDELRVKAVTVLISNISNVLTKNGNVTGYQLKAKQYWWDPKYLGKDALSSQNGSVTLNAETGMYGWLRPTSEVDFNFQGLKYDSTYCGNLDLECDRLMFALYVPYTAQSTGRSFRITTTIGLDFKTGDTWFGLHKTKIDAVVIGITRNMCANFQQFHTNEFHWKDVWNAFKKYGIPILTTAASLL